MYIYMYIGIREQIIIIITPRASRTLRGFSTVWPTLVSPCPKHCRTSPCRSLQSEFGCESRILELELAQTSTEEED